MRKLLFISLILFSILCHASSENNFNNSNHSLLVPFVEVTTNGTAIVYRPVNAFVNWEIDFNGTVYNNIISNSQTFTINPFAIYYIRVRVYNEAWSEIATINNCTLDPPKTVGYNFDFDTSMIDECWRGYISSSSANVYQRPSEIGHNGTSTTVIQLTGGLGSTAYLVPPKLALTTDKKVKFWVKGYRGNGLDVGSMTNPYDQSTFHLLKNIPSQGSLSDQWKEITVNLNNLNLNDQYIVIKFKQTYLQSSYIYIDDFSFEQSIECFPVSNLSVSNLNDLTATAQLNFEAPGQNAWEVSIKNLLTDEVQSQFINSNPATLNNIVGNTSYELQMRAICGEDFNSIWSNTITFNTQCTPVTTDYFTSFRDWLVLDPCWDSITSVNSTVKALSTFTNGNPVLLTPRTGTKMISMATVNGVTAADKAYLISPYISNLDSNKRIKFHLISRCWGINTSPVIVGTMSDPNNSSTFVPLGTINPEDMNAFIGDVAPTAGWKEHTVYTSNFNNNSAHHYIAIKHGNVYSASNFTNDVTFFIDDFSYENIPTCPEPFYPVALKTSYDSVKLNWQSYSTVTEWQLEYGVAGFLPGTGTLINVDSNTYVLNNLLFDDTNYDFYVRSKCGSSFSIWSTKGTFKTRCFGINTGATEGFEAYLNGAVKGCWTSIDYRETGNRVSVGSQTSSHLVHSGTKSVRLFQASQSNIPDYLNKVILITPRLIDFDNTKKISFWVNQAISKKIVVGTLSDPDDYTTFTAFQTLTTTQNNSWVKYTVDFSTYTGTDEYIGIKQPATNGANSLYFDDFEYLSTPCTTPSSLQAFQVNENSVSLQWNNNSVINQPVSWQIEYGPLGFVAGTGTEIAVNSNPFLLEGLTAPTSYEFRVRNNCGNTSGDWSIKYPFKITCSYAAPFVENFEGYTSLEFGNPADFCWTIDANYTVFTRACIEGLSTCRNAIVMNRVESTATPSPGLIISPFLSDFNQNKSIKFWITNNFVGSSDLATQSNLIVGTVSNPLDFTTFVPYQTIDISSLPLTGKEFIVDFSNYTGTSKYIAFLNEGQFDVDEYYHKLSYFDDIKYVETNQNCPEPMNALAQNVSENSALVSWDQQTTATNYQIEYGIEGFTPGTGMVINTLNTEVLLSGLLSQTTYEYYLKSDCGIFSSNSIVPKKFTTTCEVQNIPWVENFDTMSQYGANQLPACFKKYGGNTYASNTNGVLYSIYGDNTIFGHNDSTCIVVADGYLTSIFTPTYSLSAGTTYTFSLMANKGYEYDIVSLRLFAGRGNTPGAMNVLLDGFGSLHQDQYNPYQFYYTPLVSGDYGFRLQISDGGGIKMLIDQFKMSEGYTDVINQNTEVFNFESTSNKILLEGTTNSNIAIETDSSNATNHIVAMRGSQNNTAWINNSDVWIANENNVTKINMKMNAARISQLYLKFMMKQNFNDSNQESMFRVVINGEVVGNVLRPTTRNQDAFVEYVYDLNSYLGGEIRISLQHIGKSNSGFGDNAYIDNLRFDTNLSTDTFSISQTNVYPNPFRNNVTVKNANTISKINLYDVRGQQLLNLDSNANEINIETSKYQAGIYFIKVDTNERSETFKVIKY